MEKIILEGITLEFNDFSKQVQEKLYLQANEKFKKDAANSKFEEIRILVVEDEINSSEFLNQMLQDEVKGYNNTDVIKAILNNPNFKMDNTSRRVLSESEDWQCRQMAAEDKGSSLKFLYKMLQDEVKDYGDSDVIESILNNPNFKMDDASRKLLAKSEIWKCREIVAKYEGSSSEFLNQMLRDGVNNYNDSYVIEAILNNPNFKMDDASRKLLAESENWEYRQMAAKDEGSSLEFLENMYLKEKDGDVFEALEQSILRKHNNVSNKLNIIQKHKIIKLLRKFKNSNVSISQIIDQIAAIIA